MPCDYTVTTFIYRHIRIILKLTDHIGEAVIIGIFKPRSNHEAPLGYTP